MCDLRALSATGFHLRNLVRIASDGVFTIMYALEHRANCRSGGAGTRIGNCRLVAGVIIAGLPGSALWAIGLLVGIDVLFGGPSLMGMALAARNADRLRTPTRSAG
jgi:uncharacterized membrane protein HdeD (DUF308 family)